MMRSVQWAPSGVALDGRPAEILRLLAEDGVTFGYGYGPGWSVLFGTSTGEDISVLPGQWVTRYDDGSVVVSDTPPKAAPGRTPSE